MTISSQVRSAGPFTGAGTQTIFPFTFKVFQTSDLLVARSTGGVQTQLALGTDYSVQLNPDQANSPGGTITLTSVLAVGYLLTITSNVPVTQPASLTNLGGFFPKTIEDALDRLTVLMQQYGITNIGQAIRVPEIGGIAALPNAAARAGYLLSFDTNGNPALTLGQSGTAGTLQADLATLANALKGAGMIGLSLPTGYATNTIGDFARKLNPLRKYGALNNDGVTDDSATFAAAAASGDLFIDARGLTCKVQGPINIPSNQIWLLAGSNLSMTGSTTQMFLATNVDNWALIGPFKITGDGSSVGTAAGVTVLGGNNWRVDNYSAYSIKGWGFYLQPGSGANRTNHGSVLNFRGDTCYRGWEDTAGTGAEYTTLIGPTMRNCVDAGMITSAGNIVVIGGHITENQQDNLRIGNGSNGNHGMFIGTNINHAVRYNLWAQQVLNGQTFSGCHWYANDAIGDGSIFLDRCVGINISGGHLDCQIYNYKDGTSGRNVIENMYCPGGNGVARRAGTNNGHDQLIIRGCYGPGSYSVAGGGVDVTGVTINDPAEVYVVAERSIGVTQALTSGVAATLLYPSTPFPDRRSAYNNATGVFTVPTTPSGAGLYRISFDAVFDGTAMNATSFVDVKLNGTIRKIFACAPYSSTKLSAAGTFDIYLAAGDVILLEATITGTTPVFGDNLGTCNFSVRKIA